MSPNLLIIVPDQLRSDYLGCYGHPTIGTRHIDQLAREGVQLDNCYCASPLCAPSRISFATSTYVGEHGHRDYGSTISPDVPNLVTSLKAAGYRTGMFGKNHLFTIGRLRDVWDELHEVCLGNRDGHPEYAHAHSTFTLAPDHPYNNTASLTDETIGFMCGAGEKPFLAWVNYQDPHPVFCAPPPYDTMFDPAEAPLPAGWINPATDGEPERNPSWRTLSRIDQCDDEAIRRAIAMYMGQVRLIDDSVGRLMSALDANGLRENTVVLFFSDHGELLGQRRMTHKLPVFYDCLTKIPVIARFPDGRYAGRKVESLVEEVDLVPTLLESLGIPLPPTMVGKSLLPHLRGEKDAHRDSILCEAGVGAPTPRAPLPDMELKAPYPPVSFGPGAMVRRGDWKLSVYSDDVTELFNLRDDPDELHNRAADPSCATTLHDLLLLLARRIIGVKTRDVGVAWPQDAYPQDVRCAPLEIAAPK